MAEAVGGLLSVAQNYSSDAEDDSGYTSEDEKKRKQVSNDSQERKRKRRKENDEEDMLVDVDIHLQQPFCKGRLQTASDVSDLEGFQSIIPLPEELVKQPDGSHSDPNLHEGRIRSFPHEEGNWASFLYIPLRLGIYEPSFKSMVSSLKATCQENNIDVHPSSDLHISLSRTLVLRLHWIQPLTEDLRLKLCSIPKFSLWLHGLNVYVNDDCTRTFLGLRACHGRTELKELVTHIDAALAEYKLPPFYKEGSFHVSLAWCTGDVSDKLRSLLPQLENICSQYFSADSEMQAFMIDKVVLKAGNRYGCIRLSSD